MSPQRAGGGTHIMSFSSLIEINACFSECVCIGMSSSLGRCLTPEIQHLYGQNSIP